MIATRPGVSACENKGQVWTLPLVPGPQQSVPLSPFTREEHAFENRQAKGNRVSTAKNRRKTHYPKKKSLQNPTSTILLILSLYKHTLAQNHTHTHTPSLLSVTRTRLSSFPNKPDAKNQIKVLRNLIDKQTVIHTHTKKTLQHEKVDDGFMTLGVAD